MSTIEFDPTADTRVPVLSADHVAVTFPIDTALHDFAQEGHIRRLRLISFDWYGNDDWWKPATLEELFWYTDEQLELCAEKVGVMVVPHCFGVVSMAEAVQKVPPGEIKHYSDTSCDAQQLIKHSIAKDALLACEVAVIEPAPDKPGLQGISKDHIIDGYEVYAREQLNKSRHPLSDLWDKRQYLTGVMRQDCMPGINSEPTNFLIDIEPRFNSNPVTLFDYSP